MDLIQYFLVGSFMIINKFILDFLYGLNWCNMKKKFYYRFFLIAIIFLLIGCNEQKNNEDNININYYDMEKFAGVWFNQSGSVPEYYLVTEDGKIFVLDKQQGESLINDYENFSKIVLSWDSYIKYRFVDGYYELYDFTDKRFFRYATYFFDENYENFFFDEIGTSVQTIYSRVIINK